LTQASGDNRFAVWRRAAASVMQRDPLSLIPICEIGMDQRRLDAVSVDRASKEQDLPAAVAFLIHDEMWVETDEPIDKMISLVRAEMEAAALSVGLVVPVRIEGPASRSR
jgi:hypothetical protein